MPTKKKIIKKKKVTTRQRQISLEHLAGNSPHYKEFPPHAVNPEGIPYALEVIERDDNSMIVKQGTRIDDLSPTVVRTVQNSALDKLRDRLIEDLQEMGYKEFERWICRHTLA